MKKSLKRLVVNYNNTCMMGGVSTQKNKWTYHHILSKHEGGEKSYKNGASVYDDRHKKFNMIEIAFPLITEVLNEMIEEYKMVKDDLIIADIRQDIDKYYPRAKHYLKTRRAKSLQVRRDYNGDF